MNQKENHVAVIDLDGGLNSQISKSFFLLLNLLLKIQTTDAFLFAFLYELHSDGGLLISQIFIILN